MSMYEVTVTETIEYTYEVEAVTGGAARMLAKEYHAGAWPRAGAKSVAQVSLTATVRKLDETSNASEG